MADVPGMTRAETLFYDVHVFCCVHRRPAGHRRGCCADKRALQLCDLMCRIGMATGLRRIRVNHAGCMNLCEHGPTMVIYPEGVWYRYETEADIEEILNEHVRRGRTVARLLLDPARIALPH
jgi:(2Fe-2S) ferredoxin